MATNSNSDQGKIDNNELEMIEVNESAQDMMRKIGIDIAYATFYAEQELSLENLKYESVVGDKGNNTNPNASDTSASGNAGGGATVSFVDAKTTKHQMTNIITDPAMAIPHNELDKDGKKKEQIKAKADKSKEAADEQIK